MLASEGINLVATAPIVRLITRRLSWISYNYFHGKNTDTGLGPALISTGCFPGRTLLLHIYLMFCLQYNRRFARQCPHSHYIPISSEAKAYLTVISGGINLSFPTHFVRFSGIWQSMLMTQMHGQYSMLPPLWAPAYCTGVTATLR